jgi:spermidine synthase
MVIQVSRHYLPGMECGFDDPRVHEASFVLPQFLKKLIAAA